MFNFSKMITQTRGLMVLRHSAPAYNVNFSTSSVCNKTASAEERLGIPPRPKRPLTPYFKFLQEVRSRVAQENPTLNPYQIVTECAKLWATHDESKKASLNVVYQKEKEQFAKDRARYENSLTVEQRDQLDEYKQDLLESREKRAYKKKVREMEKPKKPASGFLRFLSEKFASGDRGDMAYRDFQKKIVEEWKSMSDEKKQKYIDAFQAEAKEYKRELAKWELKMIRLGYVELVRQEALIDNPPAERPKLVKTQGRPKLAPKN